VPWTAGRRVVSGRLTSVQRGRHAERMHQLLVGYARASTELQGFGGAAYSRPGRDGALARERDRA
jgi:hypothetical protein